MTFDLQPTLRGELLQLRPLQAADYAALYAVASDPLLWEQHPARTRYQEPVFQKLFQESLSKKSEPSATAAAPINRDLKAGSIASIPEISLAKQQKIPLILHLDNFCKY